MVQHVSPSKKKKQNFHGSFKKIFPHTKFRTFEFIDAGSFYTSEVYTCTVAGTEMKLKMWGDLYYF
jgi:hypothetical protein